MFRLTATMLRAAAIAIPALMASSIAVPAAAQFSVSIGYDDFHSRLAPYGTWSNNPRWGEVWHPTRVESGFRPYYNGHWEDTREYGWLWVSDESWGDVPYHYGRWVSDPRDGWLWVPGYVWAPSWVVWRSGGGNIGWFPMPPDDNYYGDGAYRGNYDNQYGYRDWYGSSFDNNQFLSLWTFVAENHFRDRDFRSYAVPQRDYGRFISQTTDTTNYITINNYVVNRSVDSARLQRDTNQRFEPVPAANVIGRNALVTQATVGRQVEQRERKQRPIPVNIAPAEQRGRANVNPSVQQQSPVQAPQNLQGPGRNRNQGGNDAGQPNPRTDRTAPVANAPQQKGNQAPEAAQQRGGNRNQGANEAAQAKPQAERLAPVANAPPQKDNPAPQAAQQRGGNRNQGANGAAQTKAQAERAAAAPPAPVADIPAPNGNARRNGAQGAQANPQTDRAIPSQAPQRRGAPEQSGNAVVQDNRTPTRVQQDAPAADKQGNARNTQARGNNQTDQKNAGQNAADERKAVAQKLAADKKAADDKKKADRGQN